MYYLIFVKNHFKFFKVIIFSGLLLLEFSKSILCFISKRIETFVRVKQQAGGSFHCSVALICSPFFVHMDTFLSIFVVEGEGKATKGCAKIDGNHSNIGCTRSD